MIAFIPEETSWSVEPLSKSDVAHFYWMTDIKTNEIGEAFGIEPRGPTLAMTVGPAKVVGLSCKDCGADVLVLSRAKAKKRVADFASKAWLHYARFADPRICDECSDRLQKENSRKFFEEIEARERRVSELRTMPYRDYLQTDEWRAKRSDALRRAKFKCQTCSEGGRLNVHHRTYARRGNEHSSDLVVLCEPCHSLFHENRRLADGGRAA